MNRAIPCAKRQCTPEEGGIRPETLALISDLITSDIDHGFPSAQLAVIRNGRLVYENAWGRTCSYAPDGSRTMSGAPVTADTLYDLASVTKMFSTIYAAQKLVDEGLLDLDTPVVNILFSQTDAASAGTIVER